MSSVGRENRCRQWNRGKGDILEGVFSPRKGAFQSRDGGGADIRLTHWVQGSLCTSVCVCAGWVLCIHVQLCVCKCMCASLVGARRGVS